MALRIPPEIWGFSRVDRGAQFEVQRTLSPVAFDRNGRTIRAVQKARPRKRGPGRPSTDPLVGRVLRRVEFFFGRCRIPCNQPRLVLAEGAGATGRSPAGRCTFRASSWCVSPLHGPPSARLPCQQRYYNDTLICAFSYSYRKARMNSYLQLERWCKGVANAASFSRLRDALIFSFFVKGKGSMTPTAIQLLCACLARMRPVFPLPGRGSAAGRPFRNAAEAV